MENEKGKLEICICGGSFPFFVSFEDSIEKYGSSERECDTTLKDSPIIWSYKVSYTYRCFCNCYLIKLTL